MILRPPRSTLDRSSAASDVYKRQRISIPIPYRREHYERREILIVCPDRPACQAIPLLFQLLLSCRAIQNHNASSLQLTPARVVPVSYTHLRAHETVLDLVCLILLEKKTTQQPHTNYVM